MFCPLVFLTLVEPIGVSKAGVVLGLTMFDQIAVWIHEKKKLSNNIRIQVGKNKLWDTATSENNFNLLKNIYLYIVNRCNLTNYCYVDGRRTKYR